MEDTITRLPESHIGEAVKTLVKDYKITNYEALQIITKLHKNRILEDAFGTEIPSHGKSFLENISIELGNR